MLCLLGDLREDQHCEANISCSLANFSLKLASHAAHSSHTRSHTKLELELRLKLNLRLGQLSAMNLNVLQGSPHAGLTHPARICTAVARVACAKEVQVEGRLAVACMSICKASVAALFLLNCLQGQLAGS